MLQSEYYSRLLVSLGTIIEYGKSYTAAGHLELFCPLRLPERLLLLPSQRLGLHHEWSGIVLPDLPVRVARILDADLLSEFRGLLLC